MTDYATYEGRIEPMIWGRATYTVLRIPQDVMAQLNHAKRVEGEINEHPVNLAPTRAPVIEDAFLWAGQSLIQRIGVGVGALVEVRLRPAPNDLVAIDDDILDALRNAECLDRWDNLTPGKQRGLLYQITTAKTAPTRQKRIVQLIKALTE
jgi:hypothetical protein